MKKSISKILSIVLVSLMLLSILPAFVFAGDTTENGATEFTLTKVSETKTEFVADVELVSGNFVCFDAKITCGSNLTCTKIEFSEAYKTFSDETSDQGEANTRTSNPLTGMISVANTASYGNPSAIARYTFSKSTPDGVTSDDISIVVDSCYVSVNGTDTATTATVTNSVPKAHVHTPDSTWTITKEPTCTAEGTKIAYCTECGEIAVTESIEKSAHDTYDVTVNPTCTEAGSVKTYCHICNQLINTKVLPATGHKTKVDTKPATCTEAGYIKTVCETCGTVISTEVLPATGHQHTKTEITKPATCTEDGLESTICTDCNTVISTKVIPATGHKTKIDSKPATCTENGYIKTVCETCGTVISTKVLPATGHKWITDQKDATCTEDGYIKIKCSACGEIHSNLTTKATGHVWSSWTVIKEATYRSEGVERKTCKICGAFEERSIPMVEIKPTGITMSMSKLSMLYKQTTRLYANVIPEESAYTADITWSSSNSKIVSVDQNGNVKALKRGTATITASTAGGEITSQCTVTVTYSTVQWIIMILLFGWIWY